EQLGTPDPPAIRFTRGPSFGASWFTHLLRPVRLLALLYGSDRYARPPRAFTSRLPTDRSPSPLLGITTAATGLLCWRDLHPLEWQLIRSRYDDGGYSGDSTERPALQRLLADLKTGKVDVIVVYKVDRLTRSLADFAKLVELFDDHGVSFVSVTQQFNTTTSMGRLTLNVLLSFAQFER